jgi:beta-N-acetylhexosaminidase
MARPRSLRRPVVTALSVLTMGAVGCGGVIYFHGSDYFHTTDADTTDATIAEAVDAAKSADLVVLTYNAARQAKQRKLLERLNGTGTPVVAVARQVPYDADYVDGQRTWLTTYSTRAAATESLTMVLFGEVSPHGTLPVDISSGVDRSRGAVPVRHRPDW